MARSDSRRCSARANNSGLLSRRWRRRQGPRSQPLLRHYITASIPEAPLPVCGPVSPDVMAAAARSERSPTPYNKAPLARGLVFWSAARRRLSPVATPMAMVPTPVTVVPMVAVPVMTPADLLRLQMIDIRLRYQGGFRGLHPRRRELHRRRRRDRRGVSGSRQRRGACGYPNGECQKVTAFHPIFSLRVQ